MKLTGYHVLTGIIHCKTGLRIGGSKDNIDIGGVDSPIIRHPISGLPYVPGSSLKGKMRSLLELTTGNVSPDGRPHNCGNCKACRFFGSFQSKAPTRYIFRDAPLTEESENLLRSAQGEQGINYSELKSENWIDRKTGRAGNGGLRTFERVPAGTEFAFTMSIRIFEGDDDREGVETMLECLRLLQKDYLGSSGSRGYGQVEFRELKVDGQPVEL